MLGLCLLQQRQQLRCPLQRPQQQNAFSAFSSKSCCPPSQLLLRCCIFRDAAETPGEAPQVCCSGCDPLLLLLMLGLMLQLLNLLPQPLLHLRYLLLQHAKQQRRLQQL